ncbi:hypothetical protein [Aliivibrio fischeri]|uniref:Uncharacterized protein n=1 Tax=Aliivibrio fischeri TaxID=668 RepID=A0A844P6G0_ALIFS|nr:hypothetical protein [Aliivibrio fischeri]MUK50737.1 hypothetical protein [Aliivibrio fischeri]
MAKGILLFLLQVGFMLQLSFPSFAGIDFALHAPKELITSSDSPPKGKIQIATRVSGVYTPYPDGTTFSERNLEEYRSNDISTIRIRVRDNKDRIVETNIIIADGDNSLEKCGFVAKTGGYTRVGEYMRISVYSDYVGVSDLPVQLTLPHQVCTHDKAGDNILTLIIDSIVGPVLPTAWIGYDYYGKRASKTIYNIPIKIVK